MNYKLKKIVIFAVITFLFIDCKPVINNKCNKNVLATELSSSDGKIGSVKRICDCKLIKEHAFSAPNKIDTFKLMYNCNNLEDSMIFQIVSSTGFVIYEEKFLGISFYDYGRPWYAYVTDPERGKDFDPKNLSTQVADSLQKADLEYIRKRMNEFFSDDNFIANPIKELSKDMLNDSIYTDIINDSTVIGFEIHLFVEGFDMIGYSKKMQKVQHMASSD